MTEREQFEKVFPVPDYVTWDNAEQSYMLSGACMNDEKPKRAEMRASAFFNKWSGWQAAKADSAAQAEALTFALENLRLFAARHRKEAWAQSILLMCNTVGVTGSPLRDSEEPKP